MTIFTIAIVIQDIKNTSAENVMLTLAEEIQKKHRVHFFTFKKLKEYPETSCINLNNFKKHHFKKHYRWIPKRIRGLVIAPLLDKFILKKCGKKPDLILSNLLSADRILSYSKLNSYFVIHSPMSKEIADFGRNIMDMEKIYSKKPSISVSKGVMNDFIQTFSNNTKQKKYYIYNPVNIDQIKYLSTLPLNIELKDYIIHIGKFNNAKRQDILIKAYAKSKIKNPLILVGTGPTLQKNMELVDNLKLKGSIFFVGFQNNPYPLIKNSLFMVSSSDYEGLGMVILESLALGVPVISTDCESGPREILPQKNLCPVNDIKALSELIIKASINPTDYQVKFNDKFSVDVATQKYLDLI